ncbi:MAG: ABC transporter permease [Gordonia amarae]
MTTATVGDGRAAPAAAAWASDYVGTGQLFGFFLRRSRLALVLWVLGTAGLYPLTAAAMYGAYPTQADLDKLAASMSGNATVIAMAGPDLELNTIGGQTAWQLSAFGAILAGLMSTFLVARHARSGEESGADELIGSDVVGRGAPIAATVLTVLLANLGLIVIVGLSLTACGLSAAGSWTLGAACGLTGLVFGSLALIFAQVSGTTRGVWGMSGAAIGLAYALRAVGDVSNNPARWLSPIGWGQQARAYAGERWWPRAMLIVAAVVAVAVATVLRSRRDFGSGLLRQHPGPSSRAWGGGAYELSWRLARPAIIGWILGLMFGGAAYGSIGDGVDDVISGDSDLTGSLTGGQSAGSALVDGFYGSAVLMFAIIAAGFAVNLVLRAHRDETAHHAEPLLVAGVRRTTYLASHVVLALTAPVVAVVAAGAASGLVYGIVSGGTPRVAEFAGAGLGYAPALWTVVAVTVVLVGAAPRFAALSWVVVAFAAVAMFFGPLLKFPQWLLDISPFTHIALVPLDDVRWTPLIVLTVLAAALIAAGTTAFTRRDIDC